MVGISVGDEKVVGIIEAVRGRKMHVDYRSVEHIRRKKDKCEGIF